MSLPGKVYAQLLAVAAILVIAPTLYVTLAETNPPVAETAVTTAAVPQPLTQLAVENEPETALETDIELDGLLTQLTGALLDARALLNQTQVEPTNTEVDEPPAEDRSLLREVNQLRKQLFSLMDETSEDQRDVRDGITESGTLNSPTVSDTLTLSQTTAPAETGDTFYNLSGDIYWDGTQLNATSAAPLFTDGGDVTYLSSLTDGLAIGATTSSATLSLNNTGTLYAPYINSLNTIGDGQVGNTYLSSSAFDSAYNAGTTYISQAALTFGRTGGEVRISGGEAGGSVYISHGLKNGGNVYIATADDTFAGGNAGNAYIASGLGASKVNAGDVYLGMAGSNGGGQQLGGNIYVGKGYGGLGSPHGDLIAYGNIGIGTESPTHELTVVGDVYASSFIDDGVTIGAPDFVFDDPAYIQLTLEEIEAFTTASSHLPWLTPADTGPMALGDRINEILEGLENLFLRVFDLNRKDTELETKNIELESRIEYLEEVIEDITGEPVPEYAPESSAESEPAETTEKTTEPEAVDETEEESESIDQTEAENDTATPTSTSTEQTSSTEETETTATSTHTTATDLADEPVIEDTASTTEITIEEEVEEPVEPTENEIADEVQTEEEEEVPEGAEVEDEVVLVESEPKTAEEEVGS